MDGVTAAELEEVVKGVITRYRRAGDPAVTMRRPLLDLGVDILALVDIVTALEAHYCVELDPDEILSWLTAADMVETLSCALAA